MFGLVEFITLTNVMMLCSTNVIMSFYTIWGGELSILGEERFTPAPPPPPPCCPMTSNSSEWNFSEFVTFVEFHKNSIYIVAYKSDQMGGMVRWGRSPKSRFLSQNLLHLHTVQVHIIPVHYAI